MARMGDANMRFYNRLIIQTLPPASRCRTRVNGHYAPATGCYLNDRLCCVADKGYSVNNRTHNAADSAYNAGDITNSAADNAYNVRDRSYNVPDIAYNTADPALRKSDRRPSPPEQRPDSQLRPQCYPNVPRFFLFRGTFFRPLPPPLCIFDLRFRPVLGLSRL
jgi:hypothetical protein